MNSSYSKRIYLLLKKYNKIGKRVFNVEQLQDILKVPKSLKVYADFKRKALKKRDRYKFTDLEVKLSEKSSYIDAKEAQKLWEYLHENRENLYIFKKNLEEAKKHIYLALAFSKSISKTTMFIKR